MKTLFFVITTKKRHNLLCSVLAENTNDVKTALEHVDIGLPRMILELDDVNDITDFNNKSENFREFITECLTNFVYQPYNIPVWSYKKYDEPNMKLLNFIFKQDMSIYVINGYISQNDREFIKRTIGISCGILNDKMNFIPYFHRLVTTTKNNETINRYDIEPVLKLKNVTCYKSFIFTGNFQITELIDVIAPVYKLLSNETSLYYFTGHVLYEIKYDLNGISFKTMGY